VSGLLAGEKLSADAAVDVVGARVRVPGIGALAVRYGNHIRARLTFPDNFRNIVLGSGDVFASDNTFRNADLAGQWLRELNVVAATAWRRKVSSNDSSIWFPTIGFGVSVNKVEGIVNFDADPSSNVVTTVIPAPDGSTTRTLSVKGFYTFRSSVPPHFDPASAIVRPGFSGADSASGDGWGGSVGLSAVIYRTVRIDRDINGGDPLNPQTILHIDTVNRDAITFGVAVDEIGSLEWSGFNLQRVKRIDTIVTDSGGGVTSSLLCGYTGDLDTIGNFTTELPTQLRIGVGVDITAFIPRISGDLIASFEASAPLKVGAIGGEKSTRVALGLAWTPVPWLALRTGLQFGGSIGSAWSLGAGVMPFRWLEIAAATSEVTSLFASDPERYDASFRIATHVAL
jgi:hypothetical protein